MINNRPVVGAGGNATVAAGGVYEGNAIYNDPAINVQPAIAATANTMAEPLHIQRLESALNMRPFMAAAKQMLSQPLSSGDDSDEENSAVGTQDTDDSDNMTVGMVSKKLPRKRLLGTKQERQNVKAQIYNFSDLTSDREWLYELLLSDTESEPDYSDEDAHVKEMLKVHVREQKHRENFYKKPTNTQYAYYGSGLLSNHDMFPEHQQSIVGVRKRRRRTKKELLLAKLSKSPKPAKSQKQRKPRQPKYADSPESGEVNPADLKNYAFADTLPANDDDLDDDELGVGDFDDYLSNDELDVGGDGIDGSVVSGEAVGPPGSQRVRQRRSQLRTPEVMAARRRRVWQLMAKKEIGRCQRAKLNNHKEMLQNCKRVAGMCMKVVRQRAIQSQRLMKETVWRAKRLTREMLAYWKRYERVERDQRRRMEREAEEQRKQDVELIEAKRQQRKLNFLITQTELYAHFMSKKLGQGTEEDQLRILSQLDEEVNPRLAAYDDYDVDEMKQLAQQHAEEALNADQAKAKQFMVKMKEVKSTAIKQEGDSNVDIKLEMPEVAPVKADLPQPDIFKGTLKTYQIKGMTWLANLYDQGISGILADEMGLGKTVQSIAFLCHIAERYGVWGPFLIISPASTLHNWQQEMARFVPDFNVVPYWGSPNERKILRQFWEQKDLHTREASFHVVITSYQLIVSDYKYFNRIKWQYMVLDEAQAIKSAASQRWKLLLGFNCRNRLLLSGTPIQNSMAELWALLHFIMPTLFDSHDEFNEWFSKDIESHAENKTGIDEKQISRLHMILKPFMLRRIKKDVENELSDKIEIMVYCPLTIRQKLLYMALKQKIRIEDLLHLTTGASSAATSSFTSNLMNLVMQFRKVCNHPELFERRDAKSPFNMQCAEHVLPRLVFDDALLYRALPSKRHLLYNRFAIFKAAHIQKSLWHGQSTARYDDLHVDVASCFGFTRFCDYTPKDIENVTINGLITFLTYYRRLHAFYALLAYRRQWWPHYQSTRFQLLEPFLEQKLQKSYMLKKSVLRTLLFTGMTTNESSIYAFGDYKTANMQETIEHRVIRSKILQTKSSAIEEFDVELVKTEPDLESVEVQVNAHAVGHKAKHKSEGKVTTLQLLPEFVHRPRKPTFYRCEPLAMPRFLYGLGQRVQAVKRRLYCESRASAWAQIRHIECENAVGRKLVESGLALCRPRYGWSSIVVPDKETLISDAGKLAVLDSLLTRLKADGHRVLIYSQMTKMIDLLEEYMWHRKHRYMRLDGSSKISERRDMVADFQTRADIFVFLLSTRAGGLGINLTAADTVIFYDSDWNPTVDQQAMDRAHRLGQTKQVTVYRLICKGTIEERILQRAREKSEIQRMVISGGNFKPDTLKPKEVVSLLLDDEEIEMKYRQKAASSDETSEPSTSTAQAQNQQSERKRRHAQVDKQNIGGTTIAAGVNSPNVEQSPNAKRLRQETDDDSHDVALRSATSSPNASHFGGGGGGSTPAAAAGGHNVYETYVPGATSVQQFDDSDNETLVVDGESSIHGTDSPSFLHDFNSMGTVRRRHHPRGTKRGRPRGSGRRGGGNGALQRSTSLTAGAAAAGTAAAAAPAVTEGGSDGSATTPTQPNDFEAASDTPSSTATVNFSPTAVPSLVKRGPGRPRLKTGGPVNRGTRGAPRARRPMGPLLVPIGRSPAATPLTRSPILSPAPSGHNGSTTPTKDT